MSYNQDDGDNYGSGRNTYSQDDSSPSNNYGTNNRSGNLGERVAIMIKC